MECLLVGLQGTAFLRLLLLADLLLPLGHEYLLCERLTFLRHWVVVFEGIFREVWLQENELSESVEQALISENLFNFLLVFRLFVGTSLPFKGHVNCIWEHTLGLGEEEDARRYRVILLNVLEIIDNFLVLNQLRNSLNILDAVILDLALVHLRLIADDPRPVHGLEQPRLQLIRVVVLFWLEAHLAQTLRREEKIELERHDQLNERLELLGLRVRKTGDIDV